MPLYKTIQPNAHTKIFLWKIEASFDELAADVPLTAKSEERLLAMKSELHQRAYLSIRHLLKEAGYCDYDLFYKQNGKPLLKNGKYISITHSFQFAAVAISDREIGIDIEKNREKITIIQDKFVNLESGFINPDDALIDQLTVIWGAKESLYKIYPHGGLTFKHDIDIDSFKIADKKTTGHIKKKGWEKTYSIGYEKIEDYTLVYAFDNTPINE